jgi:hypothetical protein
MVQSFFKTHEGNVRTSQETHYVSLRAQQVNAIYRFLTMVY